MHTILIVIISRNTTFFVYIFKCSLYKHKTLLLKTLKISLIPNFWTAVSVCLCAFHIYLNLFCLYNNISERNFDIWNYLSQQKSPKYYQWKTFGKTNKKTAIAGYNSFHILGLKLMTENSILIVSVVHRPLVWISF